MDHNTPAAAALATDATPNTNSNPAPETSAQAVGPTSAPAEPDPFDNFVTANGGREKVLEKMKQAIGNPQEYARSILGLDANNQPLNAQPQAPATPAEPQIQSPQQTTQPEPFKPAEGFITPNEYFAQKYNEDLAAKYPDIADYIKKGEYLKEATAWGLTLVDQQGNMNAKVINEFLELKSKAAAPAPTSMPVTTTPTVDYVHQEGDITSQQMADEIMKQGTNHPRYKEALTFTRERIFGKPVEKPAKK